MNRPCISCGNNYDGEGQYFQVVYFYCNCNVEKENHYVKGNYVWDNGFIPPAYWCIHCSPAKYIREHKYTIKFIDCPVNGKQPEVTVCAKCGGTGILKCAHGFNSSHSYCSHNKTSQHDD